MFGVKPHHRVPVTGARVLVAVLIHRFFSRKQAR